MTKIGSLCVYCGSRSGADGRYEAAAVSLGRRLAKEGIEIIYGGSAHGLMGAVANAALQSGGRVVGILPGGLASREKAHDSLTEMVVVGSMHERKALMEARSDGFVALSGGLGTLEELCETLTWSQLGIHQKPVGILNIAGFYDPFLSFLDQAMEQGFMDPEHRELLLVESDPEALLDRMRDFEWTLKKVWLDRSEL